LYKKYAKKLRIFCRKSLGRSFLELSAQPYGPRLGVEAGVFAREETLDQSAADHLPRREVVERRGVDQRHRVAERKRHVEVVRREEDALALVAGQPPEQRRQLVAVREVEERRGFVEQDDRGVLGQRAGDHHPLALAVGHTVHGLAGEGRHPYQAERTFDDGAVGLLHAPDPVGVGGASQRHDVLAGEVGDTDLVGGDEPHGRGQLVGRERRQRAAAERHIAGDGRSETCNGPQQGAFARAVAADQRGQRPLGEGGGDIFEQRAAAVGERDMVEGDTHVRRYCGCGRRRR